MTEDLQQKLLKQLSQAGYVLEMRVAATARAINPNFMYVHQGRQYVDTESNAVRETDVVICDGVSGSDGDVFHYAIVECKGSPHPWVAFTDAPPGRSVEEASAECRVQRLKATPHRVVGEMTGLRARVERELFPGPTLFDDGLTAYSVVQPMDTKGKDHAWDAVRQAMSAATGFLNDIDPTTPEPFSLLVNPVVVTSAPLFACWLDGQNQPSIAPIASFELTVRKDLESLYRAYIVNESEWPNWLERFRQTTRALSY